MFYAVLYVSYFWKVLYIILFKKIFKNLNNIFLKIWIVLYPALSDFMLILEDIIQKNNLWA